MDSLLLTICVVVTCLLVVGIGYFAALLIDYIFETFKKNKP